MSDIPAIAAEGLPADPGRAKRRASGTPRPGRGGFEATSFTADATCEGRMTTDAAPAWETVQSADGTNIGYWSTGTGQGLVVVHGMMRSAQDYVQLATRLADTFTVHVLDRRGRGHSGPQGPGYSLGRESEDLIAVLRKTGANLLFGHSFGGAVALEAALTSASITRMALYEPAVSIDGAISVESVNKIEAALRKGRHGAAMLTAFDNMGGSSTPVPASLRVVMSSPLSRLLFASPPGKRLRVLVEALLAESRVSVENDSTYKKYAAITVETLFMHGANSPAWLQDAAGALAHTLPHTATITLDGVSHSAPCEDAPELVADTIKKFFTAGADSN